MTYIHGTNNVVCDKCGVVYKAFECQYDYAGLLVCNNCYEEQHPQEFVKATPDIMTVPIVRTVPTYTFIENSEVTLGGVETTFNGQNTSW